MNLSLIIVLTIANALSAFYCLRHYATRSSILQLFFVIVWTMHYVVGNILVLVSINLTYTLSSFARFSGDYVLSLLLGQYFLWTYIFLLDLTSDNISVYRPLRPDARAVLLLLLAATTAFGLWFIWEVGPAEFFSQELAQYGARLGEYAFKGIGVYYYLASFLLPATILLGSYAIAYPLPRNIAIFAVAFIIALVVFVPLGGRGRALNVIFVLVLDYAFLRRRFQLRRIANPRNLIFLGAIVAIGYVWGVSRSGSGAQIPTDPLQVAYSLSVDTTRLPVQAFILHTYPPGGSSFGMHYVESLLGPFYPFLGLRPVGLVSDLSARWYYETIFGYDVHSAISPSLIGESYITFGVIGILISPIVLFLLVRGAMLLGGKQNSLSLATVLYFVQFNIFHGGLYAMFDMAVIVVPIILFSRWFASPEPLAGVADREGPQSAASS
jgi:oligosaccharide repeat unit polymerase